MKTILLFAAILAGVFAPAFPARAQDYILGEGDLIRIRVYENGDLNTVARVSGDGMISFPLVGTVKVSGLSQRDAELLITRLLDKYIVAPQVQVFIEEHRSRRVTILGEVEKPGTYELTGSFTLLELISWAEGLSENAGDNVIIQRRKVGADGEETAEYKVNLREIVEKGRKLYLQEGDKVYVTKGGVVYVTGAVKKPGAYKAENGLTVMKAIALAEGYSENASTGKARLTRKVEGEEKTFKAEGGFLVEPDDLIFVPESLF